jgi:hypothetical protein
LDLVNLVVQVQYLLGLSFLLLQLILALLVDLVRLEVLVDLGDQVDLLLVLGDQVDLLLVLEDLEDLLVLGGLEDLLVLGDLVLLFDYYLYCSFLYHLSLQI